MAALARSGTRGKDVEDELRTVDDLTVGRLLQIALLGGREIVVEDQDVGAVGEHLGA